MARPATGTVEARRLADGTHSFHLRFRANGTRQEVTLHERLNCECDGECGGGWDEPAARHELGNILARVRAGVWEPREKRKREPAEQRQSRVKGYTEVADWWIDGKVTGEIGDAPIEANTESDYRWRLSFSKAFFGEMPVDELDGPRSLDFRAHLFSKAKKQREEIAAGADLRDRNGRKLRPLDLSSIKKAIDAYAAVLDEAAEEGLRGEENPARSKRMRVKVPKPKRSFLEMDELAAVLDAARDQDVPLPDLGGLSVTAGSTAERVARLAAGGQTPKQIGRALRLAKPTVTYHLRRLGIEVGRGYVGRKVVCEILGRAGLRASELCDVKIGDVRLHAAEGVHIRIVDSKTAAGERVVIGSPDLGEAIVEHLDRLRRAGHPTGPADYLVPNTRGGRMSRQRVGEIVRDAAELASKRLIEMGLPPLPTTTPHTLRRTFISMALRASEFDVKWVQDQVGHEDSTMTTDVYNQLQHRVERKHGPKMDRLIRDARQVSAAAAIAA